MMRYYFFSNNGKRYPIENLEIHVFPVAVATIVPYADFKIQVEEKIKLENSIKEKRKQKKQIDKRNAELYEKYKNLMLEIKNFKKAHEHEMDFDNI